MVARTLWEAPSQTKKPETPDVAVVEPVRSAEMVPLTTAETERPGTTLTTCVPRTVTIVPTVASVCPTPSHTIAPVTPDVAVVVPTMVASEPRLTETPGTTETTAVPRTVAIVTEPLTLTTVVPAPAVTVPVTTTGNAVVDWPPAIQRIPPVALIEGTAVVRSMG